MENNVDELFWNEKWKNNEIAFHEGDANPALVKYFKEFSLAKGSRVFLPLCGKTLDIAWLLSNGYQVAGAELSEIAIEQLFMELGLKPEISELTQVKLYRAKQIDIFGGNIFHLTDKLLGSVDVIYDRAALVALPAAMRNRYTAHLTQITGKSPQLLISYEYDQSIMEGPPFSVIDEEIILQYGDNYDIHLLASTDLSGGMKGKCPAKENIWLLQRKNTQ